MKTVSEPLETLRNARTEKRLHVSTATIGSPFLVHVAKTRGAWRRSASP